MNLKIFFSFLFILFTIFLLVFYWFVPFDTTEFEQTFQNSVNNSSLASNYSQFYPNMRFPESRISYMIDNCPLNKQNEMIEGFKFLEQRTILRFYLVSLDEEISVSCDSSNKIEDGLFIAGEGGPSKFANVGNFNVISNGMILLIRDSSCSEPIVAIHELLHVLGFDHSSNSRDIMYPVIDNDCNQEINQSTIDLINELYSISSYPDLVIENVTAVMHGKYLDTNLTVRNYGLRDSIISNLDIYADDKLIKEFSIEPLEIGDGKIIYLTNVWVNKFSFDSLRFYVNYSSNELNKENNEIKLENKK